jgi:uncharacterized membrane protein YkoI
MEHIPMNTMKHATRIAWLALLGACSLTFAASRKLPEKAAQVIEANFPDARITGLGRERERGAWYYEVALREGNRRFEVEVTDDGVIGEIEGRVLFADLPPELQQKVRERVGRGRLARIEKHERRGVARSGKFVPISTPRISYEIKYYTANGERRELQLASSEVLELPKQVKDMVAKRFPDAEIEEAEAEDDEGVLLFVLSLREGKERFTVVASRNGDLVEQELFIADSQLPSAARKLLRDEKDYRKADSPRIVAWETYGQVVKGKLINRPDRSYMVTLSKDGMVKEYRFDQQGKLTEKTDWEAADDDDDGEDDDDD